MARDLSLDMSADPDEFEEALREFAARRVISRTEADKLENYAKRRAWWISGVAQMDIVSDAHRSILEAMRSGIPFEEWQKEAGPKLEAAWGRPDSARLLTIFRNACTQALNSGRWEQMNEPHVKAMRPYVEYDVVDDQRTTEHICRPLIGVVLPIDDPFVLTHNPPLHHRCRTGLRSKRKSYVDTRGGVTKDPPEISVTPGFGYPPNLAEVPKPQHRKVVPDPEIEREMLRKASHDARERKSIEIKFDPKETPEYWERQFREVWGDAARPMGYGRAVAERAKGLLEEQARSIVAELQHATPGVTWLREALDGLEPARKEAANLLLEHHKLSNGYEANASTQGRLKNAVANVGKFFRAFASPRLEVPTNIDWRYLRKRAFILWDRRNPGLFGRIHFDGDLTDGAHEFGHAIELCSPRVQRAVQAFLKKRTAGEVSQYLSVLTGNPLYGRNETAKPDKFVNAYVGKDTVFPSSEVLSTALGWIANGKFSDLVRDDPDMAYLVLGILAGWL